MKLSKVLLEVLARKCGFVVTHNVDEQEITIENGLRRYIIKYDDEDVVSIETETYDVDKSWWGDSRELGVFEFISTL